MEYFFDLVDKGNYINVIIYLYTYLYMRVIVSNSTMHDNLLLLIIALSFNQGRMGSISDKKCIVAAPCRFLHLCEMCKVDLKNNDEN